MGLGYGGPGFSNSSPGAAFNGSGSGVIQTHALANDTSTPLPPPFPPINYTQNYISTPGDGSGLTSTDSNGGNGLNYYLIFGLLAVAAIAILMVMG